MGDAANGPGTVFAKLATGNTCSGTQAATDLGTPSAATAGTNTSTAGVWVAAF